MLKTRTMVLLSIALAALWLGTGVHASSHSEAPGIAKDPSGDLTDVYAFVSYETGQSGNAVLILNSSPYQHPAAGPNYHRFDSSVVYTIHVDNDEDGLAEINFEFRFKDQIRGTISDAGKPFAFWGIPPISSLDGPGSEGLGLRQLYTVTQVQGTSRTTLATGLIAAPPNVGPHTTPNYGTLADQAIHPLAGGGRVFAGPRDDPFYIDIGAVFDLANLGRNPPLLTPTEDADDGANSFGINMNHGFTVQTIALEIPINKLTRDRKGAGETKWPVIGVSASTKRAGVQLNRLGHPLVNMLLIGTKDKDLWSRLKPNREGRFLDYYLNPRLAMILETLFTLPAAKSDRQDLRDGLLKYKPDSSPADLLRLNVQVSPTPFGSQRRLGPLASPSDLAGWPFNGRRPVDDVVDVAFRIVGGSNYIAARIGDGVNKDEGALLPVFPFLAHPIDGRDLSHP